MKISMYATINNGTVSFLPYDIDKINEMIYRSENIIMFFIPNYCLYLCADNSFEDLIYNPYIISNNVINKSATNQLIFDSILSMSTMSYSYFRNTYYDITNYDIGNAMIKIIIFDYNNKKRLGEIEVNFYDCEQGLTIYC